MSAVPEVPEITTADLAVLMEESRTCVLVHDAATKTIIWANRAACDLLGWSVTEFRPLTADDMSSTAPQYHRVLGRAWLQDAVERGSSRIEWHYRTRSGRVIPTDALALRVELNHGTAVMVQFRDIEREQQTEQALRRTTSSIDALARQTSTIALLLDAAGTVRLATDTAMARLDMTPVDTGRSIGEVATLHRGRHEISWGDLVDRAHPAAEVQLEVGPPADTPVWLEGTVERLADPGDGFLMILHDVSGRMQREAVRERELHRENYQARYTAMGDMAMAIAHELGQPLAAAGNFLAGAVKHLDLLQKSGCLTPESAELLTFGVGSAIRQIDRVSSIVTSVRAFVGHLDSDEKIIDLREVVDECLYFVMLRAGEAGIEVVVHQATEALFVRCERVLTGQVLLNLCFNAIDEMAVCRPEDRRLEITISAVAGEAVVTVDDYGRGIRHDPLAESFTSKEHGSGIGLALSYRIITRQHGYIWAEPRLGRGSRFGFRLPIVVDPPD
ncbi:PAS domain-containing sensor histidine kinase [Amycolatopsis sp. NPDC004368]